MKPNEKTQALSLIDTALSAVNAARAYINSISTDIPTTPEPPVVEPPTPPTPTGQLVLYAMKGETVGFELRSPKGTQLPAGVQAFEIRNVRTTMPSFKGAAVGDWEDPLVPVTSLVANKNYWIDFLVQKTQSAGQLKLVIGGLTVTINVVNAVMPDKPTMPMYMELQFAKVSDAHNLPDEGSNLAARGELNAKYRALYRSHRIEPIKQAIAFTPTDLDQWKEYGVSFRQTTLEGAIADPILIGPNPSTAPTKAQLQLLYKAAPNGLIYAWDEGQDREEAEILARLKQIKRDYPAARTFITHEEYPALAPYVDIFVPVANFYKRPGHVMTYTKPIAFYEGCMANGNCQNKTNINQVEPAIGTPMMVLDSPKIHQRAFNIIAYTNGAKFSLYFNGTQKLTEAWKVAGLYSEGGNGDGTLVYPSTTSQDAWPSLRMKYLLMGLNDVEWMALAKTKGITFTNPVKNAFDWSKDPAVYEAMRKQIAGRL